MAIRDPKLGRQVGSQFLNSLTGRNERKEERKEQEGEEEEKGGQIENKMEEESRN